MYQDSEPIVLFVKPFVWWCSRGVAAWFCWSSLSPWYESYEVLSFSIEQKFREVSGGNHQHKCFVFSLFDLTFLLWVNRFLSLKVKITVEPRVIKIRRKNEGNFSHRSRLASRGPHTIETGHGGAPARSPHLFFSCLLTLVSLSNHDGDVEVNVYWKLKLSVFYLRNSKSFITTPNLEKKR